MPDKQPIISLRLFCHAKPLKSVSLFVNNFHKLQLTLLVFSVANQTKEGKTIHVLTLFFSYKKTNVLLFNPSESKLILDHFWLCLYIQVVWPRFAVTAEIKTIAKP